MCSSMYANTFLRSSLSIFERSGLISVSPSGRIPSFAAAAGFGAADSAGAFAGPEQPTAITGTQSVVIHQRIRIMPPQILPVVQAQSSFARLWPNPRRVRAPLLCGIGFRRDKIDGQVVTDCVRHRVGAELVEELQRGFRRRHERILLQRRRRADELELAVEVSARDVCLKPAQAI